MDELECSWCGMTCMEVETVDCEECGQGICDWCMINDVRGRFLCEDCYADLQLVQPQ